MRTYEALYIIKPEAEEDEVQTIVQGVEKLITDDGGAIVRSEVWGKRRLAYEVKGFTEGIYVLLRFEAKPEFIKNFEAGFKLNESIIRDLVVLFDEKTLRLEEEQVRRNAAALESRNATGPRGDDDGDRRPARVSEPKTAEQAVEA